MSLISWCLNTPVGYSLQLSFVKLYVLKLLESFWIHHIFHRNPICCMLWEYCPLSAVEGRVSMGLVNLDIPVITSWLWGAHITWAMWNWISCPHAEQAWSPNACELHFVLSENPGSLQFFCSIFGFSSVSYTTAIQISYRKPYTDFQDLN